MQVAMHAGALLPHPFSLACDQQLPIHRRFTFCCTFRRLTTPGFFPALCPVESRPSSIRLVSNDETNCGHPADSPPISLYRCTRLVMPAQIVYSKREPRLGVHRPPSTPPNVANEIARKLTTTRLSQETERTPRIILMHWNTKAMSNAGQLVSIP